VHRGFSVNVKRINICVCILVAAFLLFSSCHWLGGGKRKKAEAEKFFDSGMSLAASKRYDEAIKAFDRAIALDDKHDNAYWARGISWAMKKENDRAIADYNRALEINPRHPWVYHNRGCAWRDKGEYDRAIEDFTRYLDINPRDAEAYNNRAFAWAKKGDYRKALSDAKKALSLKPDNEVYRFAVAKLKAKIKKSGSQN
jgi:tetratricopeptide (TPR) repeat protein